MSGTAESRINSARNRLHIIKQTVLRNEHFSPSTLPSRDREHLVTVWSRQRYRARSIPMNIETVEIDKTAAGQSWRKVLAPWHARA